MASVQRMTLFLCLVVGIFCLPKTALCEDVDAFALSVKSNAMLAVDVSGSMRWPVYDHNLDYKAFFEWAVSNGHATDKGKLGSFLWEKNKIYLVSAYIGYSDIVDPHGGHHAVIGDPLYSGKYLRQWWVRGGIIDTGWKITDWNNSTANTIDTDGSGHVVYPALPPHAINDSGRNVSYASASMKGQRFFNTQDILLTDVRMDPRTNTTSDYGFIGYLKSAGVYFSGLFETGSPHYTLTKNPEAAAKKNEKHRVYAFVTGNFLSFIKLIEDLKGSHGGMAWETLTYGPTDQRIFSRLEIVQQAMNQVVADTEDKINWGVLAWGGGEIHGKAQLGSSVESVQRAMNALVPNGGTPMGGGMQEAYNYSYDYLAAHADLAVCTNNYLIVLTDGFPSGDTRWNRIAKGSHKPDFSKSKYQDGDTWGGDPTQGGASEPNYSDDVARWLYNSTEVDYPFSTHTIGFGLESPLLQDVAAEGGGLNLTAYDREQLINAFYSLSLAMTSSVSFVAPSVSLDQANRVQAGNELYMASFKPEEKNYWQGNLKRYHLKWYANGTEEVLDKHNASATTPEGVFKDLATSYWSTAPDGGNVNKGGAGALLKAQVDAAFSSHDYYRRPIKTWRTGGMFDFTPWTMKPADFGVPNDKDAHKIVNFMHGYTYGADGSGNPEGVRDWVLGDIIHSTPMVLDYVDHTPARNLIHRYVVVGANDAMLHVFDSETGVEKFAFMPPDFWQKLKGYSEPSEHLYGPDGYLTRYYRGRNPELLIMGERRGGSSYWALNCQDMNPTNWSVAWHIEPVGAFAELGQSWSEMVVAQNVPRATGGGKQDLGVFCGGYDPLEDNYNGTLPEKDTCGRGIFVININDGTPVFSVTYGENNGTSGNHMTRTDMNFCFPGSPTIITNFKPKDRYKLVIYAVDIASQVWKVAYDGTTWSVFKLFASNGPGMKGGSSASSGFVDKLDGSRDYAVTDQNRKCFVEPEVSYVGDCSTDRPVIYFGTGDKAHPKSTAVSNRFYAVFDMSHDTSVLPLDETDLLNITCDELDVHSQLTKDEQLALKHSLGNNHATQAQGWYIALDKQRSCPLYYGSVSHEGEKVTNAARLLNKKIYFNSYAPSLEDPCNPKGRAFFYALKYCYGTAAFDLEPGNIEKSVSDRYFVVSESTPPSPINIISGPKGNVIIKASAGSKIINRHIETNLGAHLYWWKYADENK